MSIRSASTLVIALLLVSAVLLQNGCLSPTANSTAATEGGAGLASEAHDLTSRFEHLSCAVVRITSEAGGGTGFFIDNKGTIVTVAHVVFDQKYVVPAGPNSSAPRGLSAENELTPKKGLMVQVKN